MTKEDDPSSSMWIPLKYGSDGTLNDQNDNSTNRNNDSFGNDIEKGKTDSHKKKGEEDTSSSSSESCGCSNNHKVEDNEEECSERTPLNSNKEKRENKGYGNDDGNNNKEKCNACANVEDEQSECYTEQCRKDKDTPITFTLLITVAIVTLGSSFQFGFANGVMNNPEDSIRDDFRQNRAGGTYTNIQWATVVSGFGVGGLFGAILGPQVIGKFVGRRSTLLINNVFVIIASALMSFAQYWWIQLLGRIVAGIVAGITTSVVPTYFSEISPVRVRGAVGTMNQLGITFGIFISQLLSTPSLNLLGSIDKWPWLFSIPVLMGVLELIVLPFCPRSPSYLYSNIGEDQAKCALDRLVTSSFASKYLDNIKNDSDSTIKRCKRVKVRDVWTQECEQIQRSFTDTSVRKQLIVGIMVQLMMQWSGVNALFFYSSKIFIQSGISDPELATTFIGLLNFVVTIAAVKLMDQVGRKTLLIYPMIGMSISFTILALSLTMQDTLPSIMGYISVGAVGLAVICFALGPGCIAWFIMSEIFPNDAKEGGATVGAFANWLSNWIVSLVFPTVLKALGGYTFLIFTFANIFFVYFTIRYVPETKSKTIKEVTDDFKDLPKFSICGL